MFNGLPRTSDRELTPWKTKKPLNDSALVFVWVNFSKILHVFKKASGYSEINDTKLRLTIEKYLQNEYSNQIGQISIDTALKKLDLLDQASNLNENFDALDLYMQQKIDELCKISLS